MSAWSGKYPVWPPSTLTWATYTGLQRPFEFVISGKMLWGGELAATFRYRALPGAANIRMHTVQPHHGIQGQLEAIMVATFHDWLWASADDWRLAQIVQEKIDSFDQALTQYLS